MKEAGDEKLYTRVFKQIRSYIIENKLQPGDYLPTEQTFYTQLGVSRNVLREAIKSMELMGMVESCAGRGTVVKEFSLDYIFENALIFSANHEGYGYEELTGIRRSLELAYLPHMFVSIDKDDLKIIREYADKAAKNRNDPEAFWLSNRDFHLALLKPIGNNALGSLLSAISVACKQVEPEKTAEAISEAITEHAAILNALETKKYEAFSAAMQKHAYTGN